MNELLKCCHCHDWANQMTESRPFRDRTHLMYTADTVWNSLSEDHFLYVDHWCVKVHLNSFYREAFQGHPQIGNLDTLRAKFASTSDWASTEQQATSSASETVLVELAQANADYLDKYGFIFIGKCRFAVDGLRTTLKLSEHATFSLCNW